MAHVKTAISLEEKLFKTVEKTAKQMHSTRSRLVTIALEEYLQRQKNRKMLEQINTAYEEGPTEEEKKLLKRSTKLHKKLVAGEW